MSTHNDIAVLAPSLDVDEFLTPKDIARRLKFADARPVYAAINSGELPAFDINGRRRVAGVDFVAWLNRNRLETHELEPAAPVQKRRRGGRSAAAALAEVA